MRRAARSWLKAVLPSAYFCFFLNIESMRCVTRKPPKMLTDASAMATKPMSSENGSVPGSRPRSARPR